MLRSIIGRSSLRTLPRPIAIVKPCQFRTIHATALLGNSRHSGLLLAQGRTKAFSPVMVLGVHAFHSTQQRKAAPIVPLLLGALKVSALRWLYSDQDLI